MTWFEVVPRTFKWLGLQLLQLTLKTALAALQTTLQISFKRLVLHATQEMSIQQALVHEMQIDTRVSLGQLQI
jgi:hypothetical protein